jgi:hypothetical protein
MVVLAGLASFYQCQEHVLVLMQVEIFAHGHLEANDAVEFSEEGFLRHDGCSVNLTFVKIDLSFILMVLLVGWMWR